MIRLTKRPFRLLLVRPPHSINYFLMLGPSWAYIFTTGGPSVANRRPTKCGPRFSSVPVGTSVCSFIEASKIFVRSFLHYPCSILMIYTTSP